MDFVKDFLALRKKSKAQQLEKLEEKLEVKELPFVYALMTVASRSGVSAEASIRCIAGFMPLHFRSQIDRIGW